MKYSIPSSPAIIDTNTDGFADVIYIGDLGGQVWKWDVTDVGEDTTFDGDIDTWEHGIFFTATPEDMGGGAFHYRSFFLPPAAAYQSGVLTLAFGSGERDDLNYQGDVSQDDNNRMYVVQDVNPTGASAFPGTLTGFCSG